MITVGEQRFESESLICSIAEEIPELEIIDEGEVTEGVYCWAYKNPNDNEKDLGLVLVKAGYSTPRQLVFKGEKTVEVFFA